MLLMLAMVFSPAWMRTTGAVDVSKDAKCTLTVLPGSASSEEEEAWLNAEGNLVADVYLVAEMEEEPGYDTYRFKALDAYSSLMTGTSDVHGLGDLANITGDDYRALAVMAAKTATGGSDTPVASAAMGEELTLTPGLYLVMTHGKLDDYVVEDKKGPLSTIADSGNYIYYFEPALIALPTTSEIYGPVEDGQEAPKTSDGKWYYSVTATMKNAYENNLCDLTVTKKLLVCDSKEKPTVKLKVEVWRKGEKPESDKPYFTKDITFDFTEAGEKSEVIADQLTVNSYVKVTEEFGGKNYVTVSDKVQVIEALGPDNNSVTFVNTYEAPPTPPTQPPKQVKTGDDTQIMPFIIIAAVSALAIILLAVFAVKRLRDNKK